MTKLKAKIYGCDLYIDGDEHRAEQADEALKTMYEETYSIKPDWYYKAKAKAALGVP